VNIFILDRSPAIAAQYHVDKHCVKMILESAQLLSTAHRIVDGIETTTISQSNRRKRVWHLPDHRQSILYDATHVNHPCAIWARTSKDNYLWLYQLFVALCKEYTYRYEKVHKCESSLMFNQLSYPPSGISTGPMSEPALAMPDQYKVLGDSVQSYRNYYNGEKQRMFAWKNRPTPDWIK